MIVELIIRAAVAFIRFLGDLMPVVQAPPMLADIEANVLALAGEMAPMGMWLPFSAMATSLGVVMTCFTISFVIRLTRIIASFLTAGGGAAG